MYFNARTKNHLRRRLLVIARDESNKIFPPLKKYYPQLVNLTIAFEDVPSELMLKSGVKIESEYFYDNDKNELALFLFNIYMAVENDSGDFRRRIREAILTIGGDLTGADLRE